MRVRSRFDTPIIVALDFAELSIAIDFAKRLDPNLCKVKVGKDFRADKRTLIAQIKPWANGMSPAVSVYLDRGGRVKCVDSDNSQAIAHTNSYSINLTDGKWHTVVMNYFKSDSNGYCEIIIDGTKIIKLTDFNTCN